MATSVSGVEAIKGRASLESQHSTRSIESQRGNKTPAFTVNEELLKKEMSDILGMLTDYMKGIEESAKKRRVKRLNHTTGDYNEFRVEEKRFLRRLEYGKGIMNAIVESLKVVPDPSISGKLTVSDLYGRINQFNACYGGSVTTNVEEMSFILAELMVRFARICETEGVLHGLPVQAYPNEVHHNQGGELINTVRKWSSNGKDKNTNEKVTKIDKCLSSMVNVALPNLSTPETEKNKA